VRAARGWLPVGVLLLATLGGCGDGETEQDRSGLSADEQTAADNLGAQIIRDGSVSGRSSEDGAVTDEQATCIAEGAVTDVGLTVLQGYGILTEELKVDKSIQGVQMQPDDADALAGVFVRCIDAEQLFEERFLSTVPKQRAEEAAGCLEELIDEEFVVTVLSSSFQGKATGDYDRLQKDLTACTGGKAPGQ
jgi:hypothetical protein